MSLVCDNCGHAMGPCDDLPGKDGTMVYVSVLSLIWIIEESATQKWDLCYTRAPQGYSLCFRCIADKLIPPQKPILDAVYEASRAEVEFERIEESRKGKWISGEELQKQKSTYEFYNEWKAKQLLIPTQFIFCNTKLPDNKNPYFSAVVMDRVYCEKSLTLFMGTENYSWSDFRTGRTNFQICVDCFKKNFYGTFEAFSCSLRNIPKQTPTKDVKPELIMTLDFIEALKKEVGGEKTKELLKGIAETFNPKVTIETSKN